MNSLFSQKNKPIKLYRFEVSGHCHRVELMLSLLELPFEVIELNRDGSNQPDDFLEISPFAQVPVIDDNGFKLCDSNAIIVYLVKKYDEGYSWLPEDAKHAAMVQRWLSIAAGELLSGPGIARFSKIFNVKIDYETAIKKAEALFKMMDHTLSQHHFLIGDQITIADIACFTYAAHAPEGGIDLEIYPNIQEWILKISSLPNFVSMKSS